MQGDQKGITDLDSAYNVAVSAEATVDRGTGVLELTLNVDGELDCTEYELSVFDILLK